MTTRSIEVIQGSDKWQECPICGDTRLEGGNVEIDGIHAWQHVHCVCGAYWTEVYEASHREIDTKDEA